MLMPFFCSITKLGRAEARILYTAEPGDDGIGHTARPRPIAVTAPPTEAASPDPQQPMCYL